MILDEDVVVHYMPSLESDERITLEIFHVSIRNAAIVVRPSKEDDDAN